MVEESTGIWAALLGAWFPWAVGVAVVVPIATFLKQDSGRGLGVRLIHCEIAVLGAALTGSIMGTVLGFLILSFGGLIGRSGTTGTEYFGYWEPGTAWGWASFFGALPGALGMPLAYFVCLREIPYKQWPRAFGVGVAFTLGGGVLGALTGPLSALVLGVLGFLVACLVVCDIVLDETT
jgi:hypothetical protein